ncbi:MAG: ABC transporter ATP-binding protein [Clostridiaceae bacterium]
MKNKKSNIIFSPPKIPNKLISYVKKYKKQFIVTAVSGILFNSAIVLGPIFQGKLLDAALSKNINKVLLFGFYFIMITLSFQISRFFKRYYVRDMANRMSGDMRVGIMESILSSDLNNIEKGKVGDMMSTTIGDVDIVVEAVRKTITELWDTGVLMIAYLVALLIYDAQITLLAAIPIPFVIIFAQLMRKTVSKKSKEARTANAKTTMEIRKIISEINILRLYGREEAEIERFKEKLDIQAKKTSASTFLKNGLAPIYESLASIGIIVVIALGGDKVIGGNWTIGEFTAYIIMFMSLCKRTTTAAKVFNIQQGAKASWNRVKPLFNNKKSEDFTEPSPLFSQLVVEKLSFKYPTGDKTVIKNISFKAKKGMIVGITGSVGSGKSALGLCLTGLYDYEGNIYFDNNELRNISYNKKIDAITYMGHDSSLFSESVEDNITWGEKLEKDSKLNKVLSIACLNEDIKDFENGVKTNVGEKGKKVSGGQKQRISLARALYKDSSIVILDDPFSAVDIYTEDKIIQEIRKNNKDKIILLFSHRLHAFQYSDLVLVLDKGEIKEQGTHKDLLEKNGIYSNIIDSQDFMGGDLD